MPKKSKINPDTLGKEAKVLELRRGGLTFDLIAQRLGYASASGAHKAYKNACLRIVYDDVVETRNIEMDRLNIAQAAIWGDVINGVTSQDRFRGVVALMKIMERRARLLGLDMPTKAQIEVNVYEHDAIDSEVKRLVAILNSQQASALDAPISESGTITN